MSFQCQTNTLSSFLLSEVPVKPTAMASWSSLLGGILFPTTELALKNAARHLRRLRRYLNLENLLSVSDFNEADKAVLSLEGKLGMIRTLMRSSNDQLQGERVTCLILSELKDVLYEVEDLADELEYYYLDDDQLRRRKAEEDTNNIMPEAAATSLSRRRKRLQQDAVVMIEQIRQITNQLNQIDTRLNDAIRIGTVIPHTLKMQEEDFNVGKQQPVIPNKPVVTSSFVQKGRLGATKLFGSEKEKEKLKKMLTELSVSGQISILPVLGTGGVGKTTLVQCIFFDYSGDVAKHFNEKAWINLSGTFDRVRITREIVESFSLFRGCKIPCIASLEFLQRELEARLAGKKLFLVLDDVWSREWMELLLFLESTEVECVKIVVIARDPKVLDGMGKRHETILKGLDEDDCWSLLMNYAFYAFSDEEDPHNYPPVLADIGRSIVKKLKGSPLAAKAVGRMLGQNLSEEHWVHLLHSNLWDLDIDDPDDIMSALTLWYNHLSPHLQLCFVFCSVFPKDYEFDVTELIYMWTAHGYVPQVENISKTAEELGHECVKELLDMSFIEYHGSSRHFRIHDLLHDLAYFVSSNECYIYEGQSRRRIPETVHHLCVRSPIELSMVYRIKNLRTLVLYKAELYILELEALKRVRVLVLVDYDVKEFPDAVLGLKHLHYLDLYRTSIKSAPESVADLRHLRILRLPDKDIFPESSSKCTSLWIPRVQCKLFSYSNRFYGQEFIVDEDSDSSLAKLRNMEELRGTVTIRALENVKNKEVVRKLELKNRNQVESLRLFWSNSGESCDSEAAMEVLEGLQPHRQLRYLYIDGYMGVQFPSWLSTLELRNLCEIKLSSCKNLSLIPPIGQLPSLKSLFLSGMDNVTIVLSDDKTTFPSLEKLELEEASVSFEMSSSSEATKEGCMSFPHLRYLRISKCNRLSGFPWPMLSSLKRLRIFSSPGLSDQLPQCLIGLTSLKHLDITHNFER